MLGDCASIRVIIDIFEGANECLVHSETDLLSGPVKMWLKPVGYRASKIGCHICDFTSIRKVMSGIREEDESNLSHKLGEFGTSAVKILRFMKS